MSKLALNDVNIFYGDFHAVQNVNTVSYTHLTLPTKA